MKTIIRFITIFGIIAALVCWGYATEASAANAGTQIKSYTHKDGVTIKVHYRPEELTSHCNLPDKYAENVLKYAKEAYNTIVYEYGFNAPGFTFANPDKDYCYDRDGVIDIYIRPDSPDAPTYDIVRGQGPEYDAFIEFPADYKDNTREMKGMLFHEMLHVITYSYNKNIRPWYTDKKDISPLQGGDWYVEGTARYFETLAGFYDNFFSKGFIKEGRGKIVTSQEGANFLMDHPSQPLEKSRYDYALFWAYIYKEYGMKKIEEISRRFRFASEGEMKKEVPRIMSTVLGEDFKEVLKEFALAMYLKRFNPDIKRKLNDVKFMTLKDFSGRDEKEVGSWASNFIALDLSEKGAPKTIAFKKTSGDDELKMTIIAGFDNNKIAYLPEVTLDEIDTLCEMNLADMRQHGVRELTLIITNANPTSNIKYTLLGY